MNDSLKKPDEFISTMDKAYRWTVLNWALVSSVCAIFLFVIFGIVGWRIFHHQQQEKRMTHWFEYSEKSVDDQVAFLEKLKKDNLYAPVGIWAALEIAIKKQQNDCPALLQNLSRYVGYGDNDLTRTLIYEQVGRCFEDLGQNEQARDLYQKASKDSDNYFKSFSLYKLAWLNYKLGNKEDGLKMLEEMLKQEKDHPPYVIEQVRLLKRSLQFIPESIPESVPETLSSPETLKSTVKKTGAKKR